MTTASAGGAGGSGAAAAAGGSRGTGDVHGNGGIGGVASSHGGGSGSGGDSSTHSGGTHSGGTHSGGTHSGGTHSGGTHSGGTHSGGTHSGGSDGTASTTAAGAGGVAGVAGSTTDGAAGAAGASPDCVPFVMPDDCVAAEDGPLPAELRCTGLYADWESRTLRCDVRAYAPAYELWSDGASKQRFVHLPPGSRIDVTNPESFLYPVGTQFWKEFWLPGDAPEVVGETRLLRKTASGWLYTTYVWSEDGSTAVQTNTGVLDLHGTGHTVPTREQCRGCHAGRGDFILGWDFLMLGSGASGVTLETLVAEERIDVSEDAPFPTAIDWLELEIPGDAVERAGLGYLHANCGVSCHNRDYQAGASITGFYLRLDAATLESVQTTDAVVTGVNVTPGPEAELPPGAPGSYYEFRPRDPARSLAVARMNVRTEAAMPLLGTNVVDRDGVDAVSAWIDSMTVERGYPAAAP